VCWISHKVSHHGDYAHRSTPPQLLVPLHAAPQAVATLFETQNPRLVAVSLAAVAAECLPLRCPVVLSRPSSPAVCRTVSLWRQMQSAAFVATHVSL